MRLLSGNLRHPFLRYCCGLLMLLPVALLLIGVFRIGTRFRCSRELLCNAPNAETLLPGTPPVHLGWLPTVTLPATPPPDAAEAARIRGLIRQLSLVEKPNFGAASRTDNFAPIIPPYFVSMYAGADENRGECKPFTELVRLGPRALPFLLAALNDKTPTRQAIEKEYFISWMQFSCEVPGNPANARETTILSAMPKLDESPIQNLPYRVTVGDVCFDIVGQIVGRNYFALRGQPTGGLIVNSPTQTPALARAVNDMWSSNDPARHLLDNLLLDYATRGVHPPEKERGSRPEYWLIASWQQQAAAERLLFYFPREAAPLIARRLNGLQVRSTDPGLDLPGYEGPIPPRFKRDEANAVATAPFIESVSWCPEPEIRAAIRSLFQRSDDPDVLLACLPGLDATKDRLWVQQRFASILRTQSPDASEWIGEDGYTKLAAIRRFGGESARPLYREYLREASAERCSSVCDALRHTNGTWDREFLWPMLSDTRLVNSSSASPKAIDNLDTPNPPYRVCDEAAEAICVHRHDVTFTTEATWRQRNQQLRVLRTRLGIVPVPQRQ